MTAQDHPVFEITATFPNVGRRTGAFEFKKATVSPSIRTGFLVENRFSDVAATFGFLAPDDGGGRRGVSVDAGGGQHVVEVDAEIKTGEDGQWGYSNDAAVLDEGTATGGDRVQKVQVFQNYLLHSSPDSFGTATLEYGERSTGGEMSPLGVVVEDPSFTIPRGESSSASLSAKFISTLDLADNPVTSLVRTD